MQPKQSSLEALPPNDDLEFWDGEVNGNLRPQRLFDDDHYFIRTSAVSAQCTKCSWGFDLDPGDTIRDGHLYNKENKLVI